MLSEKYNHKEREKHWQQHWRKHNIFKWQDDLPREKTFVIDTPPPTVSGLLHMGHVFSYTQADFVARFWRMYGKDVFYPMGFDDNGLPTERLVEKIIGKKAAVFESENGAGSFVNKCREVVEEAEKEFEDLFNSIALSVDWSQKYQTISLDSQKISQASFVDLCKKGFVKKERKPAIWDCVDQTVLSQADLEELEVLSKANFINFESEDGDKIEIMTTRPELLPACVALLLNPNHFYAKKIGATKEGKTEKFAYSPVFGVRLPIIIDNDVKIDEENKESNVTGAVMCCTYGDENDVKWAAKYHLDLRQIINEFGKFCSIKSTNHNDVYFSYLKGDSEIVTTFFIDHANFKNINYFQKIYNEILLDKKIKQAREDIINFLTQENFLTRPSKEIKQNKKIAERSKFEIEYIVKEQWYIKILPFKEDIKKQIEKCAWHPEYMKVRALQWCENLNQDWCISRQRFFGVPIPAWKIRENGQEIDLIIADVEDLPIDPRNNSPENRQKILKIFARNGYLEKAESDRLITSGMSRFEPEKEKFYLQKGEKCYIAEPETDILDTWATSSISPQLSSKGTSAEIFAELEKSANVNKEELSATKARHQKLFPADMRPQAHEIIRTWAFYTIVKAFLHEDKIPWQNLMISGWCLAADKTKMSKSKGNVVTPTALVEEKGSDIVRYWASTSHLGADTAYSEDVFKIGQKLVTKLFNAAKFVAINFDILQEGVSSEQNQGFETLNQKTCSQEKNTKTAENFAKDEQRLSPLQLVANKTIFCTGDLWILSRLHQTIAQATSSFEKFEYARAREKIEEFFWKDFCDNYLEIVKVRSYGLKAEKLAGRELNENEKQQIIANQLSAIHTLKICLNTLLKLFAPFIPHICEEIYAEIFAQEFAQTKSINVRGNWPKLEEFFFDETALNVGAAALEIIFEVRKFKSDNNLSMKSNVQKLIVQNPLDLTEILPDLENVCNALEVDFSRGEARVEIL